MPAPKTFLSAAVVRKIRLTAEQRRLHPSSAQQIQRRLSWMLRSLLGMQSNLSYAIMYCAQADALPPELSQILEAHRWKTKQLAELVREQLQSIPKD